MAVVRYTQEKIEEVQDAAHRLGLSNGTSIIYHFLVKTSLGLQWLKGNSGTKTISD